MKKQVLLVDDDRDVISSISRLFYKDNIVEIISASNGEEGIKKLEVEPAPVIIADQRMPGIPGNEFLSIVKKNYPDTVRIMMTGYADIKAIEAAINNAGIFRYVQKPWNNDTFRTMIYNALTIAEFQSGRTESIQDAVTKDEMIIPSVVLPFEMIYMTDQALGNHQLRVAGNALRLAREIAHHYPDDISFDNHSLNTIFETGLLHDIGLLKKPCEGRENAFIEIDELEYETKTIYSEHPVVGEWLVKRIPGKKHLAHGIRSHHESFAGGGFPDGISGDHIPLIARLIRIVSDFDEFTFAEKKSPLEAIDEMERNAGIEYDPVLFNLFCVRTRKRFNSRVKFPY